MLKESKIEYQHGETVLEAYCVYDNALGPHKKPGILVAHDWSGRNDFACQKAKTLAKLGYVGYALDMYGKNKVGKTKEEKQSLMQPLVQDRAKLQQRMVLAVDAMKQLDCVDPEKTGAIGFCFGGLCVLDLARTGALLNGVVSFHGLLDAPANIEEASIKAKVLVLHGYADPMVSPQQVLSFANEMDSAGVDWQINMYGHTLHAFTNPEANDPSFGTVYDKKADARSWLAMKAFFAEVFA